MHPAFSVIFFSTLTGLGYGLWIWTAVWFRIDRGADFSHLFILHVAALPVVVGLLSSTFHLGKPLRAWRAFSQWRTSWLSREGVFAVLAFLPWLGLMSIHVPRVVSPFLSGLMPQYAPWFIGSLAILSIGTVVCTAMIYASLKPIPAWGNSLVVPVYLGFALLLGGLGSTAMVGRGGGNLEFKAVVLLLLAVAMVVLKRRYWRDIDHAPLPVDRASALGLPADRVATVFERPHTEASYLTKEMGFVVARKHASKLRKLALVLFGAVPVVACVLALLWPPLGAAVLCIAAVSALFGAIVERWLFFAEAKHIVTLYY